MQKVDIRHLVYEGTDFIIIHDLQLFLEFRHAAPNSLIHKTLIYAPNGIEFLKVEDLLTLPQLQPYLKDKKI
jgi:hypothetical protein